MVKSRVIIAVITILLATSLALNFYFYVHNQNVTNNMMIRALGAYGSQIAMSKHFFDEYLETHNTSSLLETASCGYAAELAADVCRQASNDEVFEQLYLTAFKIYNFYLYHDYPINDTSLVVASSALDHIWPFFSGFDIVKDQNPIEYITQLQGANATATIIYYCQIAQTNLS